MLCLPETLKIKMIQQDGGAGRTSWVTNTREDLNFTLLSKRQRAPEGLVAPAKGVVEGILALIRRLHRKNCGNPDEGKSLPLPPSASRCPFVPRSTLGVQKCISTH